MKPLLSRWQARLCLAVVAICAVLWLGRVLTRFMHFSSDESYRAAVQLQDGIQHYRETGEMPVRKEPPPAVAQPAVETAGVVGTALDDHDSEQALKQLLDRALATKELGDCDGAVPLFDEVMSSAPGTREAARAQGEREQCLRQLRAVDKPLKKEARR